EIDDPAQGTPLIRRYLDAGGKVVWVGVMPFVVALDPATRRPQTPDPGRGAKVLGFAEEQLKGIFRVQPTPTGRQWGLTRWSAAPPWRRSPRTKRDAPAPGCKDSAIALAAASCDCGASGCRCPTSTRWSRSPSTTCLDTSRCNSEEESRNECVPDRRDRHPSAR